MKSHAAWVVFWLVTLGPFWLVGWGVLHATKHMNRLASRWCRFLMSVYPDDME